MTKTRDEPVSAAEAQTGPADSATQATKLAIPPATFAGEEVRMRQTMVIHTISLGVMVKFISLEVAATLFEMSENVACFYAQPSMSQMPVLISCS